MGLVSDLLIPIRIRNETRRQAADSAVARQGAVDKVSVLMRIGITHPPPSLPLEGEAQKLGVSASGESYMTTAVMATIANLEKMLDGPRDGALLRYSLGNEWMKADDPNKAAAYFRTALERDAQYSAAWKLLGKALEGSGKNAEALAAYTQGIAVAEAKGDVQAAREMKVFAKRLQHALSHDSTVANEESSPS
jgi:tetratricopeptide (TPR) repeat protein